LGYRQKAGLFVEGSSVSSVSGLGSLPKGGGGGEREAGKKTVREGTFIIGYGEQTSAIKSKKEMAGVINGMLTKNKRKLREKKVTGQFPI